MAVSRVGLLGTGPGAWNSEPTVLDSLNDLAEAPHALPGLRSKPSTYFAPHRKPLICCICTAIVLTLYLLLLLLARNRFGYLLMQESAFLGHRTYLLTCRRGVAGGARVLKLLTVPRADIRVPATGGYYIPEHVRRC